MTSARMPMFGLALLVALASAGCAQNAILELYIAVPPVGTLIDGDEAGAVRISAGRGVMVDPAISTRVYGLDTDRGVIALAIDRRGGDVDTISIDITYCDNGVDVDTCGTVIGVEHLVIRRPFYTGVNTCYFRRLSNATPYVLASPQTVGACEVGGCLSAGLDNINFCGVEGSPTTHFCNTTLNGDFCDTLRSSLSARILQ
jgi:hypothetical protein